ncbi:hypothetical protein [Parvularcula mediterranea]|uniref:hypothetical protein n=1 Tax=Parvularcula mediterranea TaxID=2732508 RepID=UPI0015658D76|nr:hypothetical protein [Parvularcula mediterranea]
MHRIATAARNQDWFTVFIETCIVVVGLLIGLQINNWNEARSDHAKADAFSERLLGDVMIARSQLSDFLERRERRLQSILKVEEMYFGDSGVMPLSATECEDSADSRIISIPPMRVPSLTEAFAGGLIELIDEPELVRALISVGQSEDRLRSAIEGMRAEAPRLDLEFPDAITRVRGTNPGQGGYRMGAECHFLDQPRDPHFLSRVAHATRINASYVHFLQGHLQRLEELEGVLTGRDAQAPFQEPEAFEAP